MKTTDYDFKKQTIPTIGNISLFGMSTKVIERSNSFLMASDNPFAAYLQEYSLSSEFNLLKHHVEPGLYVIPAARTPFVWYGVIFVRSGIYESGIFRFRVFIPQTFPDCSVCPKVIFETPVFHPYVDSSTDELYLGNNSLFSEWRKDVNHLWQLICYVKNIFYIVSAADAVNKYAANLHETNKEEFLKLVKDCVRNSRIRIYDKSSDDDPHYLIFDEYNPQIHQSFREMLRKKNKKFQSEELRSISWIQLGSLEPLSKQE